MLTPLLRLEGLSEACIPASTTCFLSGKVAGASTASWLSSGHSAIPLMRHKYLRLCIKAQKHTVLCEGFSCSPYRCSPSLTVCLSLLFC